jgi:hypothetical protein
MVRLIAEKYEPFHHGINSINSRWFTRWVGLLLLRAALDKTATPRGRHFRFKTEGKLS